MEGADAGKRPLGGGTGVGGDTVDAALQALEAEGLLVNQGRRRGRLVAAPQGRTRRVGIRVGMLYFEPVDRRLDYMVELEHELGEAGHVVVLSPRTLNEVGMEVGRVARMVEATEADAWVVMAGSGGVLEWFAGWDKPVMALFGRRRGLKIAGVGPDKSPEMTKVVKTLVGLGHRRIVLLARKVRRLPQPGAAEKAFMDALAAEGIAAGTYHLPDWDESVEGYHARLEELFRFTPPTALIVDEAPFFVAAQQFLAGRGLRVPGDVSLVCTDYDATFEWCRPEISHIRWDSRPLVKRILQWAGHVSRGTKDLRQTLTRAEFVTGGTIGPAREW